jgi:hypothetical protein
VRHGTNGNTTASDSIASVAAGASASRSGSESSQRAKPVATPSTANESRIAVSERHSSRAQLEQHREQVDERHLEQERRGRGRARASRAPPRRRTPSVRRAAGTATRTEQPQHLIRARDQERVAVMDRDEQQPRQPAAAGA